LTFGCPGVVIAARPEGFQVIKKLAFALATIALLYSVQQDCSAQSYAALARELHAANPVRDARRKAAAGDFRLIQITHAWAGPWLPGIVCFLPATTQTLHADLFHSDAIYGEGDIAYRNAEIAYASAFNQTIVAHPSYPFPDICRQRSASESEPYAQSYLGLSEWLASTRENRPDRTLSAAARLGDRQAVQERLEAGANPNQRDVWGLTPLAWAALRGDGDVARVLIGHGADPNGGCAYCATPLNLAVISGSQDVIADLIAAGAAIDADSEGLQPYSNDFPSGSALWAATVLGRHAILQQLISAGAAQTP
jgi:ankyrin repeat protein